MQASYFKTLSMRELLDPTTASWSRVAFERIALTGTPVSSQPTDYIRTKWADEQPGKVSEVQVKAMHNGQALAFHLSWQAPANKAGSATASTNSGEFPDGAAIALNTGGSLSFHTMGAIDSPLNIWHWRADRSSQGRHVAAVGVGTTEPYGGDLVKASSHKVQNGWQVVIARSLKTVADDGTVQLNVGDEVTFAVAIWDGGSQERGGLKAFSPVPVNIKLSDRQG